MRREIFQMIRSMDGEDIQLQLAMQCAPLIAGLKMSNLLIIPRESLPALGVILEGTDIARALLLEKGRKAALLLYSREQLQRYLALSQIRDFLRGQGYDDCSPEWFLASLRIRYRNHMEKGGAFPHEMGIALGYPLEDVEGFIRNSGEHFLYSGYWKVYGNLPEKLRLFRYYENAREHLVKLVFGGRHISDIIACYGNSRKKAPLMCAAGG